MPYGIARVRRFFFLTSHIITTSAFCVIIIFAWKYWNGGIFACYRYMFLLCISGYLLKWGQFQNWGMFWYLLRCLIIRSHKVSKPWDLCLELSNCSEIWQLNSSAIKAILSFYHPILQLRLYEILWLNILCDIKTGLWGCINIKMWVY